MLDSPWIGERLGAPTCKLGTDDPNGHANKEHDDDRIAGTSKVVTVNRPVAVLTPSIGRIIGLICSTRHRDKGRCDSTAFYPGDLGILAKLSDINIFVSQSKAKLRTTSAVSEQRLRTSDLGYPTALKSDDSISEIHKFICSQVVSTGARALKVTPEDPTIVGSQHDCRTAFAQYAIMSQESPRDEADSVRIHAAEDVIKDNYILARINGTRESLQEQKY